MSSEIDLTCLPSAEEFHHETTPFCSQPPKSLFLLMRVSFVLDNQCLYDQEPVIKVCTEALPSIRVGDSENVQGKETSFFGNHRR